MMLKGGTCSNPLLVYPFICDPLLLIDLIKDSDGVGFYGKKGVFLTVHGIPELAPNKAQLIILQWIFLSFAWFLPYKWPYKWQKHP